VPEAIEARQLMAEDVPGAGLLVVTSPDLLHRGWLRSGKMSGAPAAHVTNLLGRVRPDAGLVTVLDGHPATLSWLGAVGRHFVAPLGVEKFGQSGNVPDLYRTYGLDAEAILGAAARLCIERASRRSKA